MPSLRQVVDPVISQQRRTVAGQLAIIFVVRTVVNTAHRIIYPFLPSLARGLGISLAAAGSLVTARFVTGLAAPFLGPVADRSPRRSVMEVALLVFVVAGLLLVGGGSLPTAMVAFGLYGLSKVLYDPSIHAFVGDSVPYRRRGRAVGIVELSWSGAWLLGVPAAGFLIERFGWRAPWVGLAVLGVFGLGLTRIGLPLGQRQTVGRRGRRSVSSFLRDWRALLRRPRVVVLLLTSLMLTLALELPFVVYGAWLEESFGLSLGALGLASIVVGVAEATAELGTTVFTDRLGKKRSVVFGLVGLGGSLLVLPALSQLGLAGALAGVVLVMLTFEFGIVSLMPLATEVVSEARATLLSLNLTAFSLGRIVGAATGAWLWEWWGGGIAVNACAGAAAALVAACLVAWGMAEIDG